MKLEKVEKPTKKAGKYDFVAGLLGGFLKDFAIGEAAKVTPEGEDIKIKGLVIAIRNYINTNTLAISVMQRGDDIYLIREEKHIPPRKVNKKSKKTTKTNEKTA
jgi:hypothetical protein